MQIFWKTAGESMEFQHELIIPNEGLPFKIFLFEGSRGNYIREKHWHTSIETVSYTHLTLPTIA